jgi:hypothetical protein
MGWLPQVLVLKFDCMYCSQSSYDGEEGFWTHQALPHQRSIQKTEA